MFRKELARRLVPHAAAIFIIWPASSVLFAAYTLKEEPLTAIVPWRVVVLGAAGGVLRMASEFVFVGSILLLITAPLFSFLALFSRAPRREVSPIVHAAEPLLVFFAIFSGLALDFPALLRHPILVALRAESGRIAIAMLLPLILLLWGLVVLKEMLPRIMSFCAAFVLVLAGWALAMAGVTRDSPRAGANHTVLLGVDSLSQLDDVARLRTLTHRFGGAWYEKPVTPGLLTNTVWPAILMHRPVRQTGVVFIYQRVDWSVSPFQLVRRASARGCRTFSFFSDQFTTYVGSEGGFDHDRSGPKGWLQVATAGVKDASVFLPIALPFLPRTPGAGTPRNQAGTYAFDLRREVQAILTEGSENCTFTAAHLDYLHQPGFPRFSELTREERSKLLDVPVDSWRDPSLDWQYPVIPDDAISLYRWKMQHLQKVIAQEVERTGFLERSKTNRLVIFSDHGNRRVLSVTNFGNSRYHRVLLATFGIPARDSSRPISLLDIPDLLGFTDSSRPQQAADPVVEYTHLVGNEASLLARSTDTKADGTVSVDPIILARLQQRLTGFRPYSTSTRYFPAHAAIPLRSTSTSTSSVAPRRSTELNSRESQVTVTRRAHG